MVYFEKLFLIIIVLWVFQLGIFYLSTHHTVVKKYKAEYILISINILYEATSMEVITSENFYLRTGHLRKNTFTSR